jgi:hypothetical protein
MKIILIINYKFYLIKKTSLFTLKNIINIVK